MGNFSSKREKRSSQQSNEPGGADSAPNAVAVPGNGKEGPDFKDPFVPLDDAADQPVPLPSSAAPAAEPELVPPDGQALATVESQEVALSFWSREKTYRPARVVPEGAGNGHAARILRTVNATMRATLGGGDLAQAVKCPRGEDVQEWIAVSAVQFYNAACLIYGTVQAYCDNSTCPIMAAGKCEYLRKDGKDYKKPTRLPAKQYISLMLADIDAKIMDPDIFPVHETDRFPRNFMAICKNIFKGLFRLYAHIYCAHHDKIRSIGASAHLNTSFRHLVLFILEFDLVSPVEMQPLEKLIQRITASAKSKEALGNGAVR